MEKKQYCNENILLAACQFDHEKYSGNSQNWNQLKQKNTKLSVNTIRVFPRICSFHEISKTKKRFLLTD
jgi:hypothetical protein